MSKIRCTSCHRLVAVSNAIRGFGPVCAERMGISMPKSKRSRKGNSLRGQSADARQLPLALEVQL